MEISQDVFDQSEEPKLWIPKKDSCEGCSRVSKKCICRGEIPTCNCQNPELLKHHSKFSALGFCKNCGHFIINIGYGKWEHYTRAYKCLFPYHELVCKAPHPNSREEIIEFDLNLEKITNSQLTSRYKDEEAKAISELSVNINDSEKKIKDD